MRNLFFYICENKGADQLCGHRAADQGYCFHYIDITIPLLSKSKRARGAFDRFWPIFSFLPEFADVFYNI